MPLFQRPRVFAVLVVAFIFSTSYLIQSTAHADTETAKAVQSVQQDLKTPGFAKKSTKDSAQAAKLHEQVSTMSGSDANTDAIYALAAEVLGNFKDKSPEQMMAILEAAQKDPHAFGSQFTPAQRKALKDLAGKIPSTANTNP